ncbi:hypothetical protein IKE_05871 [Bacillus cereus VD196]|uniref:Uncharacterized protein n=1 Tax=Bacillus cereus VD196 TaxID=1053243 RepID=A0A9W5PYJ2_BACCE|nr:DUF3965 domain-containing protein [Bacillus cereus]EOO61597.1 hypothetical protein IKE_05871 [Bacillus cereus VD196]
MTEIQLEPNWSLVTDEYVEPTNFGDLFTLLIPINSKIKGNKRTALTKEERTILTWKEKEFYKKENLIPLITYSIKKAKSLPKFHKDEMPTLLRILRLCQEIGWYKQAHDFMIEEGLETFVQTSMKNTKWDVFTQAVAWNYIIIKEKLNKLDKECYYIWDRVKYNAECIEQYKLLLSHKEILEFSFYYLCKQAKTLSKSQLDNEIIFLADYCNNHIQDVYTLNLLRKYRKCADFLSYYNPSKAALACQYAVIAQISDCLNPLKTDHVDDYLFVIKEMLEHISFEFVDKNRNFIGKLLSYIPFFNMIQVPTHSQYIEEILYICKGVGYKEEILRNYVFIQIEDFFPSFTNQLVKNKRYTTIHDVLFYWCNDKQRINLEQLYNLNLIYEQYACG